MKKLLSSTKSTLQKLTESSHSRPSDRSALATTSSTPLTISEPSQDDVIRYRYHHGTNAGSVFVLERWLSGSMFPEQSRGGSELDAVSAHQDLHGPEATRAKWEDHWRNAISVEDLQWLAKEAKCTSIRLPIGYFTLGPQWCMDSPFQGVEGVYVNAWDAVKDFTRKVKAWGMGTLIDFHAVQGGANGEEHSGSTSGKAELWGSNRHRETAKRALIFIANEVRTGALQGITGIQLVNEATHNAQNMYGWYDEVIREIGNVDESIPIYISDAWDLPTCISWVNSKNPFNTFPRNPVIIDTHKYYTFSDFDRSQAAQQIVSRIPNELNELNNTSGSLSNSTGAQVIVGEWSCVLDTATWDRSSVNAEQKAQLIQQFGQVQSTLWQQRSGGSYFWTFKMDWMPGGEWGFKEQIQKGNISYPQSLLLPSQEVLNRIQTAQIQHSGLAAGDLASHSNYWDSTTPGKQFQHYLYGQGWELGFNDALYFFKMRAEGRLGDNARDSIGGGDKIGCLEVWVRKRMIESGVGGEFVWEWEHGFRRGVNAFYQIVGV